MMGDTIGPGDSSGPPVRTSRPLALKSVVNKSALTSPLRPKYLSYSDFVCERRIGRAAAAAEGTVAHVHAIMPGIQTKIPLRRPILAIPLEEEFVRG